MLIYLIGEWLFVGAHKYPKIMRAR